MPLTGDLSGFGIDEVIALLMNSRKSGCLSLVRDGSESRVYFDRGVIVEVVHGSAHGPGALTEVLAAYAVGQFTFRDDEHANAPTMHVDEAELSALAQQAYVETATIAPDVPDADEKLTVTPLPAEYPSLTPLQWVLLAEIPRRCTLRHLTQDRDPSAVKRALVQLLHAGLVAGTGQILPPVTAGERLTVVKGYTREEEVVALDVDIVNRWREAGCFTGKVSVAGQFFAAMGRQGLGRSIVMSAAACRLCGVRDAQEVNVTPVS